jgi:hypothetical protein
VEKIQVEVLTKDDTVEKVRERLLDLEDKIILTQKRIKKCEFEDNCDKLILSVEKGKIMLPDPVKQGFKYCV